MAHQGPAADPFDQENIYALLTQFREIFGEETWQALSKWQSQCDPVGVEIDPYTIGNYFGCLDNEAVLERSIHQLIHKINANPGAIFQLPSRIMDITRHQ